MTDPADVSVLARLSGHIPYSGPCGLCGLDDEVGARHRIIDAIAGRVRAGDGLAETAADYDLPVEAVRLCVEFLDQHR